MTEYITNTSELTAVADAIRSKAGTSTSMAFPDAFVSAIGNIPSGGENQLDLFFNNAEFSAHGSASNFGNYFQSKKVTEVNYPNVKSLTEYAFSNCSKLSRVYLENLEKTYMYYSNVPFLNCSNLETVSLPNLSLICTGSYYSSSASYGIFYGCSKLSSVTLPGITRIDLSVSHYYCVRYFYKCSYLKEINLPNLSYIIGSYDYTEHFAFCRGLDYISFPKLEVIDNAHYLFSGCTNISYVNFPICSKISGNYLFSNCTNLNSVSLPICTSLYGGAMFSGCNNLSYINLPECLYIGNIGSTPNLTSISIPKCETLNGTFCYSNNLQSISMPNVKYIYGHTSSLGAFAGCLKSVSLPNCVQIRNGAFAGYSHSTVSLPSCEIIGYRGFVNYSSATFLDLPEVTNVNEGAFANCINLESITMPKASFSRRSFSSYNVITYSYGGIFSNCQKLSSVDMPGVTEITSNFGIFYNCSYLETINISNCSLISDETNYSTYRGYVFANCYKLSSVGLPNCEYFSGSQTFQNCSSLSVFSLPKCSYMSGYYTFSNCSNLHDFYLMGSSVCNLGTLTMFYGAPFYNKSCSIYVPSSLLTEYQSATNWAYFSSCFVGV